MASKMVDFGPVATSGAFRLDHTGLQWRLVPLPDSPSFPVELHLDRLGAAGRLVAAVTVLNETGAPGAAVPFTQDGNQVHFNTVDGAFGLRIVLAP